MAEAPRRPHPGQRKRRRRPSYSTAGFSLSAADASTDRTSDVWSSADGISWALETAAIAPKEPVGYTPVVYCHRIWLVGANRSGHFTSQMIVSTYGKTWCSQSAPLSPRGGVAAWTDGDTLFLTARKLLDHRAG
jgi:hypothetical protein